MKYLSINSHILRNWFPTLVKDENNIPCKSSTVKPTFTPSIYANQQLECIALVHNSVKITRFTTFEVTRFLSSFSIPASESVSTWATLKMFRKINPGRSCLWSCFFMFTFWHYPACKATAHIKVIPKLTQS